MMVLLVPECPDVDRHLSGPGRIGRLHLVPIIDDWDDYFPCRCLCRPFEQITRTTPRRRMMRQFSQILLTDARTFTVPILSSLVPLTG